MSVLAEQYIQFLAKGLDRVEKDVDQVKRRLDEVNRANDKMNERFKAVSQAIGSQMQVAGTLTAALTVGLQALTNRIEGFVRAGLQGTAIGNLLNLQFQLISREIASVFMPSLLALSNGLQSVFMWFRRLTEPQQESIRRFAEAGAVFVAVAGAAKVLSIALAGIGLGLSNVLPGIGPIVAAMAAITVSSDAGRRGISGVFESLRPMLERLSRFAASVMDAVGPIFNRIGRMVSESFGQLSRMGQGTAGDFFGRLGQSVTTLATALARIAESVTPALIEGFKIVGEIIAAVASAVAFVVDLVSPIVRAVVDGLQPLLTVIPEFIRTISQTFESSGIGDKLRRLADSVSTLFGNVTSAFAEMAVAALPAVVRFIEMMIPLVEMAIQATIGIVESMISGFEILQPLIVAIGHSFNGMVQAIEVIWHVAKTTFDAVSTAVSDVVSPILEVASAISEVTKELLNLILTASGVSGAFAGAQQGLQVGEEVRGRVTRAEMKKNQEPGGQSDQSGRRRDIGAAGGQFEDARSLFRRLQEQALRGSQEARREQREERNAANLDVIANGVRNRRPKPVKPPNNGRQKANPVFDDLEWDA